VSREPFGRMGLHAGKQSRAECLTYAAHSPILEVSAGSASIAISLIGDEIDDAAVAFARNLAEQARVFASEVERLHAVEAAHHWAA
jgi:hypothetical protein